MLLLEWSDTRVRYKLKEKENWISYDLDLSDYDEYQLIIRFADDRLIEIKWEIVWETVAFDIFWEFTKWHDWSFVADIWWIKWLKKVRFNPKTIKWKVLNSIKVPEWITDAE